MDAIIRCKIDCIVHLCQMLRNTACCTGINIGNILDVPVGIDAEQLVAKTVGPSPEVEVAT